MFMHFFSKCRNQADHAVSNRIDYTPISTAKCKCNFLGNFDLLLLKICNLLRAKNFLL